MKYVIGIVVLALIAGAVWLLGTSGTEPGWSADRVRERLTPGPAAGSAAQSTMQNVNIHLMNPNGNEDKPAAKPDKPSAPENLQDRFDPKSPDPTRSWSNAAKVKAPVNYMTAVLQYLGKKQNEVKTIRFDIGVTCQEWESKYREAEKNTRASLAILQEAVQVYKQAEKTKSWPVDYAYRTYTKQELELKLNELEKRYLAALAEQNRIRNGLARLRDTLRKQDNTMEELSLRIKTYSDNLELVRSGKLTGNVEDFLKSLERSVASQEQLLRESQQQAEKEIFAAAVHERHEAAGNLPDILRRYDSAGPEK